MAYADYDFYLETYYGNVLSDEDFDRCAARASDYIDYITMGKAKTYADPDDAVKKCCCALAEQYQGITAAKASIAAGELASETVGSHSVSYRSGAEVSAALKSELWDIALGYLLNTGLLYRGVPCIHRM